MTSFPGSPRLVKGAIVGIDKWNPLASVIVFRYNPEELSRSIQAQTIGTDSGTSAEVLRLKGAPTETITISNLSIDATDQLEKADPVATSSGIYPQLSALEMLLYPKSAVVIANAALKAAGAIEIIQPEAPLTLFIWGEKRVLPVRITELSISEKAHDPNLNPILAEVTLSMQVLSYNNLQETHPGYALFLAHQVVKEAMAVVGSTSGTFSGLTGKLPTG
jgi:hypothetical protein